MKDYTGSIKRNERKESDNHPDLKGSCMIGGTEYWINGWKKASPDGNWLSLSFRVKEARQEAALTKKPVDPDDDLPF